MMKKLQLTIWRALPILIFVFGWESATRYDHHLSFFFGQPSTIGKYFVSKMMNGTLEIDIATTVVEVVVGFILGNIGGLIIGLTLWCSRTLFEISQPYVIALGAAPVFALAPLLIIWFGTGMLAKICIVTMSTIVIALSQSYTGAGEVDADHIRLLKSFGANKGQIFRKVVAPSSIVWVIAAFRMNVSFALLGAFIAEYISSSNGLGHMILVASGLFDISLVLCGVFCFVGIALCLNWVISLLEDPIKHGVARLL